MEYRESLIDWRNEKNFHAKAQRCKEDPKSLFAPLRLCVKYPLGSEKASSPLAPLQSPLVSLQRRTLREAHPSPLGPQKRMLCLVRRGKAPRMAPLYNSRKSRGTTYSPPAKDRLGI